MVTTPDPHAAGSARRSQWWVIDIHSRGYSGFKAIMATVKPPNNPYSSYAAGPFTSQNGANNWIQRNQTHGGIPKLPNPGGWLGSLGGDIASGLEQGLVSIITDLFKVIVGPVEIIIGVIISIWAIAMWTRSGDTVIGALGILGRSMGAFA